MLRVDILVDENQLPSMTAFEVIPSTSAALPNRSVSNSEGDEQTTLTGEEQTAEPNALDGGAMKASGGSDEPAAPTLEQDDDLDAPTEQLPDAPPDVRRVEMLELCRLGMSSEELVQACAHEHAMQQEDAAVERALAAKNDFEAQIYEARAALSERLSSFVSDEDRASLLEQLEALEDWLYGDGEHQDEQSYTKERDAVRSSFAKLELRAASYASLEDDLVSLESECSRLRAGADLTEPLLDALNEAEQWLLTTRTQLATAPRHKDAPVSASASKAQLEQLQSLVASELKRSSERSAANDSPGIDEASAASSHPDEHVEPADPHGAEDSST